VKYGALFIVPSTVLVIALSTPIATGIYGERFAFAGSYFAALVAPNLLVGFGSISQGGLLNGMGETRKSLLIGVVGSLVSIVTSTLLIPLIGVYGFVIVSVLGGITSLEVGVRVIGRILC